MAEVETQGPAKKRGCGFWALVAVGVVALLVVIGSIFGPSQEEMEQIAAERDSKERAEKEAQVAELISSATVVTAEELFNAYSQNEVAAKNRYGDRALLISGTIDSVTLDFADEPVVSLQTANQFMSVQLDFDEDDAQAVSGLNSGQQFQALCNEVTEVAGTPMLDDCMMQPVE